MLAPTRTSRRRERRKNKERRDGTEDLTGEIGSVPNVWSSVDWVSLRIKKRLQGRLAETRKPRHASVKSKAPRAEYRKEEGKGLDAWRRESREVMCRAARQIRK